MLLNVTALVFFHGKNWKSRNLSLKKQQQPNATHLQTRLSYLEFEFLCSSHSEVSSRGPLSLTHSETPVRRKFYTICTSSALMWVGPKPMLTEICIHHKRLESCVIYLLLDFEKVATNLLHDIWCGSKSNLNFSWPLRSFVDLCHKEAKFCSMPPI